MAIVVITADTVNKTLVVTIDGKPIADVNCAWAYYDHETEYSKSMVRVDLTSHKVENGVTTRVNTYASENGVEIVDGKSLARLITRKGDK